MLIQFFCRASDQVKEVPRHRQAKLYPSELVTLDLLVALSGRVLSRLLPPGRLETLTPCLLICLLAAGCNG